MYTPWRPFPELLSLIVANSIYHSLCLQTTLFLHLSKIKINISQEKNYDLSTVGKAWHSLSVLFFVLLLFLSVKANNSERAVPGTKPWCWWVATSLWKPAVLMSAHLSTKGYLHTPEWTNTPFQMASWHLLTGEVGVGVQPSCLGTTRMQELTMIDCPVRKSLLLVLRLCYYRHCFKPTKGVKEWERECIPCSWKWPID